MGITSEQHSSASSIDSSSDPCAAAATSSSSFCAPIQGNNSARIDLSTDLRLGLSISSSYYNDLFPTPTTTTRYFHMFLLMTCIHIFNNLQPTFFVCVDFFSTPKLYFWTFSFLIHMHGFPFISISFQCFWYWYIWTLFSSRLAFSREKLRLSCLSSRVRFWSSYMIIYVTWLILNELIFDNSECNH